MSLQLPVHTMGIDRLQNKHVHHKGNTMVYLSKYLHFSYIMERIHVHVYVIYRYTLMYIHV